MSQDGFPETNAPKTLRDAMMLSSEEAAKWINQFIVINPVTHLVPVDVALKIAQSLELEKFKVIGDDQIVALLNTAIVVLPETQEGVDVDEDLKLLENHCLEEITARVIQPHDQRNAEMFKALATVARDETIVTILMAEEDFFYGVEEIVDGFDLLLGHKIDELLQQAVALKAQKELNAMLDMYDISHEGEVE